MKGDRLCHLEIKSRATNGNIFCCDMSFVYSCCGWFHDCNCRVTSHGNVEVVHSSSWDIHLGELVTSVADYFCVCHRLSISCIFLADYILWKRSWTEHYFLSSECFLNHLIDGGLFQWIDPKSSSHENAEICG